MMYRLYNNKLLGWKRSKKIVSRTCYMMFFIEKPRIKHLKNINLLHELPFYNKLSVKQVSKAFKRYEKTYKIERIDSNDFSEFVY